jgi:hypothetical protein
LIDAALWHLPGVFLEVGPSTDEHFASRIEQHDPYANPVLIACNSLPNFLIDHLAFSGFVATNEDVDA